MITLKLMHSKLLLAGVVPFLWLSMGVTGQARAANSPDTPGNRSQLIEILEASELTAQTVPPVIPPQTPQDLPEPLPDPTQPPALEAPDSPRTPDRVQLEPIFVTRFKFVNNTIFSEEELSAVVKPFLNRRLTFNDLLQVQSAITDLYVSQGYTTSGAFVPLTGNETVDPNNAVVTVEIIEGQVENVEVRGDPRLNNYVRRRLVRAASPVFNQNEVEEALRLLQIDPLIQSISANLSSGSQLNLSQLIVEVVGNQPFSAAIQLDNSRAPTIGEFQRGVQLSASSLLGIGETLSGGYRNTDGSNQFDVDLMVPFNADNGTLSFSYSSLSSDIIEEPFDELNIEGISETYQLSIRQPLLQRASLGSIEEVALGVTATRSRSNTTLSGTPFPLSPGTDEEGRTRINALSFFQEYSRRSSTSVFLARSQFKFGLDIFDTTMAETGPDGEFFSWRGQALWLQKVLGDSRLVARGDVQLSVDELVPLEQFSIGGTTTVRGYRQDLIVGDNGLLGSAELQFPVLNTSNHRIDIVPFLDVGTTWNNGSDRRIENNTLASIGVGLQYQWDNLFLRLNYAFPLVSVNNGDRTENRFDFTIRYVVRF
jgi:hemolysin activation/secretion protein